MCNDFTSMNTYKSNHYAFTWNIHRAVCQLYLDKTGKKKKPYKSINVIHSSNKLKHRNMIFSTDVDRNSIWYPLWWDSSKYSYKKESSQF